MAGLFYLGILYTAYIFEPIVLALSGFTMPEAEQGCRYKIW